MLTFMGQRPLGAMRQALPPCTIRLHPALGHPARRHHVLSRSAAVGSAAGLALCQREFEGLSQRRVAGSDRAVAVAGGDRTARVPGGAGRRDRDLSGSGNQPGPGDLPVALEPATADGRDQRDPRDPGGAAIGDRLLRCGGEQSGRQHRERGGPAGGPVHTHAGVGYLGAWDVRDSRVRQSLSATAGALDAVRVDRHGRTLDRAAADGRGAAGGGHRRQRASDPAHGLHRYQPERPAIPGL